MRRVVFILCIAMVMLRLSASAQTSTMKFDREVWDFGTIKEVDGAVSHRFEFTNTGKTPFVIETVTTSCGCTTPKYSREPILPSKKGYVEITFDPEGRPGSFRKDIVIVSNNRNNRNTLVISGTVTPSPRTIDDEYPIALSDGLHVPRTNIGMGYLPRKSTKSVAIEYFNKSDKTITLGVNYLDKKPYFSVSFSSPSIKAGAAGTITVTYDLRNADLWGRVYNNFNIIINGKKDSKVFAVTGIATEDFSEYGREQRDASGRANLSLQYYNFGAVSRGKTLTKEFTLTNGGKSNLKIHHIGKSSNMNSSLVSGATLAPGKAVIFTISVNTSNMAEGDILESMEVVTNDPIRPMQEIRLAAKITK